jgi:hypothetical protein
MSELHSWLSEQTNARDMRPHRVQFFTSARSVQGQKAKYSLRSDVFRFGPNNGHRSIGSACPFGAKSRRAPHTSQRIHLQHG